MESPAIDCKKYEGELGRLQKLAADYGVVFKVCSPTHVQLTGVKVVNYYPFSIRRTTFIVGSEKGIPNVLPETAVRLAAGEPPKPRVGIRRNGSYKQARKALWIKLTAKPNAGNPICWVCKDRFHLFEDCTLDHIVPLSRGGLDHSSNYALAHEKCNKERGNRHPNEITLPRSEA